MAAHTRTPGARASATGGHNRKPIEQVDPYDSATRSDLQASARVDELLFKLGDRLRLGHLSDWERQFALSVLGQVKRKGAGWSPSAKQLAAMEKIVAGPADDAPDERLIEEGGGDDGPL